MTQNPIYEHGTGMASPAHSRSYDPDTESDPLLRRYVALPPSRKKNTPVIVGASGHAYPVWSVFLTYKIAGEDPTGAAEEYARDLSEEQIHAAVRFTELYPDEVLPYVAPHLAEAKTS
jgi:hypothetical protein